MLDSKLILIDGLPGLGKSTTASAFARRLKSEHFTVSLLLETQPGHPLNVGGDLHPAGFTTGEALFKQYTPESFVEESLERWQRFVNTASQSESIHMLDSFPFQNSIRILLQMDAPFDFMLAYANQIETMLMPLNPLLIYFNQPDIFETFSHIDQITAQRGKEWTDYVIQLVSHCPYSEARNLTGFKGVMTFITEYKQLIDTLLQHSHIPRLVLEHCSGNWDECYRRITIFLGLSS
jgi:DNA polymerase III delta prime subunit